jgi:hypothetical protein
MCINDIRIREFGHEDNRLSPFRMGIAARCDNTAN